MVQQVGTARIEGESTRMVLVVGVHGKGPAQVRVQVEHTRHRPRVIWNVSVDCVRGEHAVSRGVRAGARGGCVSRAIIEIAVAVRVGSRRYIEGPAWHRGKLCGQINLVREAACP